ncbi:MAG TPA: aminoglycoside phosphotransferase family protein [Anaerolineales bacterium]|nr:aminoglycoside phosphotransferase family protein [Anaerolineales bacterium]
MKELSSTPLAQGRTADIYLWDDTHILKLYQDWCPPDWADYEARIAGAIHQAGVPSPAVGGTIELKGRRGLIYERLEGPSMLQDMNARPWTLLKHARSLAELQIQIHGESITGLPSYKDRLRYDIRSTQHLNEELRNKALVLLDALPASQAVCHGDYHPGNVLITKDGPVVIDWMTACIGSRWADVARTSLLLGIGPKSAGRQVSAMIKILVSLYHRTYLNRYLTLFPDTEKEQNLWIPVIAAARLNEDIIPEREELIKMVKER